MRTRWTFNGEASGLSGGDTRGIMCSASALQHDEVSPETHDVAELLIAVLPQQHGKMERLNEQKYDVPMGGRSPCYP